MSAAASGASTSSTAPTPRGKKQSERDITALVAKAGELKKAVQEAINESEVANNRQWAQESGTKQEEDEVQKKIDKMAAEIHAKNKVAKTLIDEFRNLYNDLTILTTTHKQG